MTLPPKRTFVSGKGRRSASVPPKRPQDPKEPSQSLPGRLWRTVRHHWLMAGILATFSAIAVLVRVVWGFTELFDRYGYPWPTPPTIIPSEYDATTAFAVPFYVSNPSLLFRIYEARFTCVLDFVEFGNHRRVLNSTAHIDVTQTIAAGAKNVSYKCAFLTVSDVGNMPVSSAHILIAVDYKWNFGVIQWTPKFAVADYIWDPTLKPPRWQPAEILR